MRRYICWLVAGTAIFFAFAYAEEDARRQLAEELLVLMEARKNFERSLDMAREMQLRQLRDMPIPGKEGMSSIQERVMGIMQREMRWENVKEDYIQLYADTFTEEELQGIIAFYKSPAGRKFVQKQPELMRKAMQISQNQMRRLLPKIQQVIRETVDAYQAIEKGAGGENREEK